MSNIHYKVVGYLKPICKVSHSEHIDFDGYLEKLYHLNSDLTQITFLESYYESGNFTKVMLDVLPHSWECIV